MKIISWNCRGIVNSWVRRHVKQLLYSTKPDAFYLLEIRSSRVDRMVNLVYSLGFTNHFVVEPLGFAGGLLLFWNQGRSNLDIISHSSQAIHTKWSLGPNDCFITFSYVKPNPLAKSRLWEECKAFGNSVHCPWLVLGDFNDISSTHEQWGSVSTNIRNIQRFVDAFGNCGLMNPGAAGPSFTWHRTAGNRVIQMRRLDKVLWNMNAQLAFPEAKVVNLPRLHSDHNPVLFIDEAGSPPERHIRPIRFEAAWLSRADYGIIWKDAMSNTNRSFDDITSEISTKTIQWNKNVFGNILNRKKRLEVKINNIQMDQNYPSSVAL